MTFARVAVPVPGLGVLDYWVADALDVAEGAVVRVPLGRRTLTGVVTALAPSTDVPADKMQAVLEVRHEVPPLPGDLRALAGFVARYYQQPLGLVYAQMVPPLGAGSGVARDEVQAWRLTDAGLAALGASKRLSPDARALLARWREAPARLLPVERHRALAPALKAAVRRWTARGWVAATDALPPSAAGGLEGHALNAAQCTAAEAIAGTTGFGALLLQGVTGSGKTEVYLAAAAQAIARGGQVLMLVPEINLTPQLVERVQAALPGRRTAALHSRLAAGERRARYRDAAAGRADLVIGTRLALFTPLPRLALVVVDEEHDPSYKQQDNVRYHGRDVAIWRAHQRGVPVVLGSATPSLETLQHARHGRYRWLRLDQRATQAARLPAIAFTSSRAADATDGLGAPLLAAIEERLARSEQSLVFVNRRGFAPSLLCAACDWRADCVDCSARLVVHRDARVLRCHHCGHEAPLPRACPSCGNLDLLPVGHGTQRLERALAMRFPQARIARVDRDTTQRKEAFADIRMRMQAGDVDVLVGTQMLAKGHDFARLTLVGVLGADNALYSADFRATERLAALLFQVAGRAGRGDLPGEVLVQTDFPTHPIYQALAVHDWDALADALLEERHAVGLPPFAHLALLAAEAPRRETVDVFLAAAADAGRARADGDGTVQVFAPVAAALARRAGMERGQVVVQSTERPALQRFLPAWREAIEALPGGRVRWALDVDPLGFA